MPKQVCVKCSLKITQAYEFKVQFEKSDYKLRAYLARLSKDSSTIKQENSGQGIIDFNSLYNTEINIKNEVIDNGSLEFHEIPHKTFAKNNTSEENGPFENIDMNEKCTQTEAIHPINLTNVYCCEYCDKKFSSVEGLKV